MQQGGALPGRQGAHGVPQRVVGGAGAGAETATSARPATASAITRRRFVARWTSIAFR